MTLRIQFSSATVKDLVARYQRALAAGGRRLAQRITALLLVGHGQSVPAVAAALDLGESTLYEWVAAFLAEGSASLVYRTSPGRPPKLSSPQKARLRELLVAGPEAAGYLTGAWSAPLVQHLIEQQFGVLFNVHYVSALLRGLGFSYSIPEKE